MTVDSKKSIFLRGVKSYSLASVFLYLINFLTVPLFIGYFGISRYGIWIAINTILIYLSNAQFGLNSVLSVLIAQSKDQYESKMVLKKAAEIVCVISCVLLFVSFIFYFRPDYVIRVLGNLPQELVSDATFAFQVLVFLAIVKLPALLFHAAFIGQQWFHLERIYVVVLPLLCNFIGLVLAKHFVLDFRFYVLFVGLGNLFIGIASVLHYFFKVGWDNLDASDLISTTTSKSGLLLNGADFFVASVSAMIITNTDSLVLMHFFGPDIVSKYSLVLKLFFLAASIFHIFNSTLWPMVSKAVANNDIEWIRRLFAHAVILLPVFGGAICVGGILFLRDLISLWVNNDVSFAGTAVVVGLGLYIYFSSLTNFYAGILSGANLSRNFMLIVLLEAAINLTLSLYLVDKVGVSGVAFGSLFANLLTSFWIMPIIIRRKIHYAIEFPYALFLKFMLIIIFPFVVLASCVDFLKISVEYDILVRLSIFCCYCLCSFYFVPTNTKSILGTIVKSKWW